MENEFSRDYISLWNKAKAINNIQDMNQIFNELCHEVGLQNESVNLSNAAAGKRAAEMLNAQQTGKSFEGSTPGKKI